MAKDPGFIFYPGDYLRDTQCLSEGAQVAYDRIMCEHMRKMCTDVNKIGITQDQLNFFTKRLSDSDKSDLLHVLLKTGDLYQIEWVAISMCKRKHYTESRSKNRSNKDKSYDEHMIIHDSADANICEHMDNENENGNTNEPDHTTNRIVEPKKTNRVPNIQPAGETDTDVKKEYEAVIEAVKAISDATAQKMKLAEFIQAKKPAFVAPYMDLWNLSAHGTGLQGANAINDNRIRKIKSRAKEPAFDFVKILQEIKQSNHLRGQNARGWKVTFDWVLENDSNYLKIIEGNYRNAQN